MLAAVIVRLISQVVLLTGFICAGCSKASLAGKPVTTSPAEQVPFAGLSLGKAYLGKSKQAKLTWETRYVFHEATVDVSYKLMNDKVQAWVLGYSINRFLVLAVPSFGGRALDVIDAGGCSFESLTVSNGFYDPLEFERIAAALPGAWYPAFKGVPVTYSKGNVLVRWNVVEAGLDGASWGFRQNGDADHFHLNQDNEVYSVENNGLTLRPASDATTVFTIE